MRLLLAGLALCTLPGFAVAATPWLVGEATCADASVRELVAGGQVVECQMVSSGKVGACTISGKCREIVREAYVAGPTPLGQFAVLVTKKTNNVLNRVGDTVTSFIPTASSSNSSAVRPFGSSRDTETETETRAEDGGISVRALLCAPQAYIPSFVARLIPTYSLGSLCGKAEPHIQELTFDETIEKRVVGKEVALEVQDSGLFILADPVVVSLGGRSEIRWGAANVQPGSCTVVGPGLKERGNWGSASTPAIFETVRFTLSCINLNGSTSQKSVEVDLGA